MLALTRSSSCRRSRSSWRRAAPGASRPRSSPRPSRGAPAGSCPICLFVYKALARRPACLLSLSLFPSRLMRAVPVVSSRSTPGHWEAVAGRTTGLQDTGFARARCVYTAAVAMLCGHSGAGCSRLLRCTLSSRWLRLRVRIARDQLMARRESFSSIGYMAV